MSPLGSPDHRQKSLEDRRQGRTPEGLASSLGRPLRLSLGSDPGDAEGQEAAAETRASWAGAFEGLSSREEAACVELASGGRCCGEAPRPRSPLCPSSLRSGSSWPQTPLGTPLPSPAQCSPPHPSCSGWWRTQTHSFPGGENGGKAGPYREKEAERASSGLSGSGSRP